MVGGTRVGSLRCDLSVATPPGGPWTGRSPALPASVSPGCCKIIGGGGGRQPYCDFADFRARWFILLFSRVAAGFRSRPAKRSDSRPSSLSAGAMQPTVRWGRT